MHRRILSVIVICTFLISQSLSCIAQETPTTTSHHCHHAESTYQNGCQSQPVAMDLSSTVASASASHINSPVNINVGGNLMAVTSGMALTPAQMIAAYQVARTGEQSLLLGADGSAIGGSFTIGSRMASHISELMIPTNVTAINRASDLNLIGNLTNAGTINSIASNPNITYVNISANNIFNSGLLNSLLNLNLFAVNDIINSGTITSSGNLTMTAGNSIQNMGAAALMQAMNSLNIQASQIINQGNIVSQLGNASFVTNGNILNINNLAGQINAHEAISFITTATTFDNDGNILEKAGITLNGGALTAQNINFNSPEGKIEISTERLNGGVNIDGGIAAVHVTGGNLNIAGLNLSGDPIFTNSGGDVAISNFTAAPNTPSDFIVLATGNITANTGTTSITTNGGNVVMSAGYLFVGSDSNCTTCTGQYSISHTPSTTGGSINLSGVTINTDGLNGINSLNPSFAGSNGGIAGNITIQSTGAVALGSLSANGGSGGGGASGNFSVFNGSAGGSSGNGGNIILSSLSNISVGAISANGSVGGIGGSGSTVLGGTGGNGANGGNGGMAGSLSISATGNVTTDTLLITGGNGGNGGGGGSGDVGGNGASGGLAGAGGSITIFADNNILISSHVLVSGGFGANGGNAGSGTTPGAPADASSGGNAGTILFQSGGSLLIIAGSLQSSGGNGGNGGTGSSTGNGGNGGNAGIVTLIGGTTVGTVAQPINNPILVNGGSAGTGSGSPSSGLNGPAILEAGNTSSAISFGPDFFSSVGSLTFITGYGTATPVITKILPVTNYNPLPAHLTGSGINVSLGTLFSVRNPVTIAQNPNGDLDIFAITNTSGEGVFTASNGTISAASAGNLSGLTVAGRDLVVIANGDISASTGTSVAVSANNGNSAGGQIIIVSGLGSSGPYVTGSSSYINPCMVMSSGEFSSVALNNSEFTTNSNLIYANGAAQTVLGGVTTSGLQPNISGLNGLPGGQVVLASIGPAAVEGVGSSGILLATGANGADGSPSARIDSGNGGMGGIISIFAGNTDSFIQFISGAESDGGDGGNPFSGGNAGNGGNGGIIQIHGGILLSDGDICACGGIGGNGGNGGRISITLTSDLLPGLLIGGDTGGNYINGILRTDGEVAGNGGSIFINNASDITLAASSLLSAISGTSAGAIGGNIALVSNGIIFSISSQTDASGKSAGGNIYYQANNILSSGDVIDARNDLGTAGIGGTINLISLGNLGLNSVISANGSTYGGRIDILADGTITIASNLTANAAGGGIAGGMIQIAAVNGGNVSLVNNAGIIATDLSTNTTGKIGINGGTGNITIIGTGAITGGEFVNIGNLDPITLAIIPPFTVVNSFSGFYSNGGTITIQQNSINTNLLQVSDAPPTPPNTNALTTLSWSQQAWLYLFRLGILQQAIFNQEALLNERLGTRIATDYTPYTTYPYQPQYNQFPLQGNIAVEQITGNGQALFAASLFTNEELSALANQGIVFGPKSNGNFFDLQKGYVLFMPNSNIQVQTKEGLVSIPKGAIAFVMETGNDAAVYDLHDSVNSKIKIVANGKELTMSPGTEILMTRNSKADFNALNPGKEIGVRNIREKNMGNGIKAYIADFTISGSMINLPVVRSLLTSNSPEHKKAADKMLKNASILADLTNAAGPYKTENP